MNTSQEYQGGILANSHQSWEFASPDSTFSERVSLLQTSLLLWTTVYWLVGRDDILYFKASPIQRYPLSPWSHVIYPSTLPSNPPRRYLWWGCQHLSKSTRSSEFHYEDIVGCLQVYLRTLWNMKVPTPKMSKGWKDIGHDSLSFQRFFGCWTIMDSPPQSC